MVSGQRMLRLIPDTIKGMLAADETPLAYELAQQFGQADAIGHDAPTLRNSVTWNPSGLLDPFGGPVDVNSDYVGAKMGGLTAGGADGSIGHRFSMALDVPGAGHLLLTTRRLAIVGSDFETLLSLTKKDVIYFSVDRRAVHSVKRAPRLFQRARVRLEFIDESWAMAMMGMFFTGAANRLINAHHSPS